MLTGFFLILLAGSTVWMVRVCREVRGRWWLR